MLITQDIETGPRPTASLIILHGLGADGSDFVPFCSELTLDEVGPVRFVLPSAPVRRVSLNNGYPMQAWYDILPVSGPKREDEASLREAHTLVSALIEREMARGIAPERIVLMGFSQGCAMTLMTGLRFPHRLAGLVAMSGYLPLADTTEHERHPANLRTPIFMAHGSEDDVVSITRGAAARDLLVGLGHDVTWRSYPMAHTLCMAEVDEVHAWVAQRLGPRQGQAT